MKGKFLAVVAGQSMNVVLVRTRARTFGSALEGARCFGKHDWTAKRRTHVVGALAGNIMRIETVEQGV